MSKKDHQDKADTSTLEHDIQHIAIIMDGNGRWAKSRGLPRTIGHRHGVKAVKRAVRAAGKLEIPYLTLFAFSSENWGRPLEEVNELMRLLRMYLRAETADMHKHNVRLRVVGDLEALPDDIVGLVNNAINLTQDNTGLTVNIALNYGGRDEILKAASSWAKMCHEKGMEPDFDSAEEFLPSFLMTADCPDPDLLIRTSGEQRLSNFLLWQCAYTEFIFMDVFWPDFTEHELVSAIKEYKMRDRRFGKVDEAL